MITINIDLGSAQEVKALVIYDHNLTSSATITLKGVDPAIFSEAVTWATGKITHYLSAATTKRYWQIQITDDANTDTYIEIGEIFLGSYIELSNNYREGFAKGYSLLYTNNQTPYGVGKKRFYNKQRNFIFEFAGMTAADIVKLEALIDVVASRSTGQLHPFYFNLDSSDTAETYLVDIAALPEDHMTRTYYNTTLELLETMASV